MRLPPRALFALSGSVSVALVIVAAVLTIFFDVAACPLCIIQRMLYLAVALLSLFGFIMAGSAVGRTASALFIITTAAGGGAIAGYQIYLQRNPFSATCGDGTAWWERMVERAGQVLPALFKADGLCSDSSWSLFGLSVVEWSLLAFSGIFILGMLTLFARPSP